MCAATVSGILQLISESPVSKKWAIPEPQNVQYVNEFTISACGVAFNAFSTQCKVSELSCQVLEIMVSPLVVSCNENLLAYSICNRQLFKHSPSICFRHLDSIVPIYACEWWRPLRLPPLSRTVPDLRILTLQYRFLLVTSSYDLWPITR